MYYNYQHCSALRHSVLHQFFTAMYYTTQLWSVMYYTTQFSTVISTLYSSLAYYDTTILYNTVLHGSLEHLTTLHGSALYCTSINRSLYCTHPVTQGAVSYCQNRLLHYTNSTLQCTQLSVEAEFEILVFYCAISTCTAVHCIHLHCIVLHYTALIASI